MFQFIENGVAHLINNLRHHGQPRRVDGLPIGYIVVDGHVTNEWLYLSVEALEASTFLLGVPGTGKTKLLKWLVIEAIRRYLGLNVLIAHPDFLPFFLG